MQTHFVQRAVVVDARNGDALLAAFVVPDNFRVVDFKPDLVESEPRAGPPNFLAGNNYAPSKSQFVWVDIKLQAIVFGLELAVQAFDFFAH